MILLGPSQFTGHLTTRGGTRWGKESDEQVRSEAACNIYQMGFWNGRVLG